MSKFEVVMGVEGPCLVLDNTRIAGPKPWGGGTVIHEWETKNEYKAIERESYGKRTRDSINELMARKDGGKSRYAALFGTPERAARTIIDRQLIYDLFTQCDDCPHKTDECLKPSGKCAMYEYDTLLEWLSGDV